MQKQKAIEILGGTITLAAKALKISYQAIDHWPDPLPDRVADRVVAYVARKKFPELLDSHGITVAPERQFPEPATAQAKPAPAAIEKIANPASIAAAYPSRADYMADVNAGLVKDERQHTRRVATDKAGV